MGKGKALAIVFQLTALLCAPAAAVCPNCGPNGKWNTPLELDKNVPVNETPANVITKSAKPLPRTDKLPAEKTQANSWYRPINARYMIDNLDTAYQTKQVRLPHNSGEIIPVGSTRQDTKPLTRVREGAPLAPQDTAVSSAPLKAPPLARSHILRHNFTPQDLLDAGQLRFVIPR